jgi:hypothetical protein
MYRLNLKPLQSMLPESGRVGRKQDKPACSGHTKRLPEKTHEPDRSGDRCRTYLPNLAWRFDCGGMTRDPSTFLRNRRYKSVLQTGAPKRTTVEPYAVVLTSVFSWEILDLCRALNDVRRLWPQVRTILSGVLPRKLGDNVQSELGR